MLFDTRRGLGMRRAVAATLAAVMLLSSGSGFGRGRLGGGAAGALGDFDLLEEFQSTTGLPGSMVEGFEAVGASAGDGITGTGGIPLVIPGQQGIVSQSGEAVTLLPGSVTGNTGVQAGVLRQLGPGRLSAMRSLKEVGVPPMPGLANFIRDRQAAIVLGKALFWDTQVGSDGNACASCHFHAGADNRMKNQLSPGLNAGDESFQPTAMANAAGARAAAKLAIQQAKAAAKLANQQAKIAALMAKPRDLLTPAQIAKLDLATAPIDQIRLKAAHPIKPTKTGAGGPNYTLVPGDFPFHQLSDPLDRDSTVVFDSNDIVSSQGTIGGAFQALGANGTETCGARTSAGTFDVNGKLTRRVPGRNSPTTINAVFNYRNFWDGRANNIFNGVNPFGPRDPDAKVLELQRDGTIEWTAIALPNASLASQAVGPALSEFEMSCAGKSFKVLGRKLLALNPLGQQDLHAEDSVLGSHLTAARRGLKESYPELIRAAFEPRWWNAPGSYDGYTQMESNFSLFWGIAIMMYESTLVSDETPFDKFVGYPGSPGNPNALTAQQQRGLTVFRGNGQCVSCHKGAEFTGAATVLQPSGGEGTVIESMFLKTGELAVYDNGFYNIGVRPTAEDRGVGGTDPFGNPLSFTRTWFDLLNQQPVGDPVFVDPCLFAIFSDASACWIAPDPDGTRIANDGAFKTPSLRNVSLTQPYFHNGGQFSLEQVVDFYNRGGDRRGPEDNDTTGWVAPDATNGGTTNLHPAISPLGLTDVERADLVSFLRYALTDPRVACERAPFDHPSLSLHNGHDGNEKLVTDKNKDGIADDLFLVLPAVGAKGLPNAQCLRNDDGSAFTGL
jgi:cytochrome c peroxidase